jgi:hypothetical protein
MSVNATGKVPVSRIILPKREDQGTATPCVTAGRTNSAKRLMPRSSITPAISNSLFTARLLTKGFGLLEQLTGWFHLLLQFFVTTLMRGMGGEELDRLPL